MCATFTPTQTGTVKWFDEGKGFGFIAIESKYTFDPRAKLHW